MRRHLLQLLTLAAATAAIAALAAVPALAAETGTTCSTNAGVAKFSPGIGESAKVQNISVKGKLGGCTGSTGTSASYVVHLKTAHPVTCASLSAEGAVAEGTAILKWGKGQGNSLGTITVSGNPTSGFSLSGTINEGPFSGLHMSSTLTGTPVFTGTGAPCSKKNPLKTIEVSGSSPFAIS
ncbi:MAG TPA: hypothetical protein VF380_00460 [Solirubrobacteraceae bacterium]